MTMPTKAQIFEHWMDWLDKRGFDWGEPCCWACKRDFNDTYDLNKPSATREEIIKNWERTPLQRCHIIARQFGGEDIPDNLFLMCKSCHDRAPNTKSRGAFLDWVEKQDYTSLVQEDIMRELRNFELLDLIDNVGEMLADKELMKRFFNNSGFHMNQARGGSEITLSSIFVQIAEELKRRK
ncbi:HNH endonuclease [Paenibacillus luteus]|uniref:HNH endonuclease n=1 Tax=Paenibacillus luteus TaxID=2545753 RepID=UPI0019D5D2EC|nr:HNH endonuclease signature motif containing protein [Paenibacillus luteus]